MKFNYEKKIVWLVVFCFIWLQYPAYSTLHSSSGVTYSLGGGRLGDNLIAVAHAKWLSYSLELPLIYVPFRYSDQLKLSTEPSVLRKENVHYSKQYVLLEKEDYIKFYKQCLSSETDEPALITLPFYCQYSFNFEILPKGQPFFQIDWDDENFVKELQKLISPLSDVPKLFFPKGYKNVALHIRTGGDFDHHSLGEVYPLKKPPLKFYEEALNHLCSIISQPLYVYIFTDDLNPFQLALYFIQHFSEKDILFNFRSSNNKQDLNVLEDFFALSQFDCLIRSNSNFSLMASKIFSYQVMISPYSYSRDLNENIYIDHSLVEINPKGKKGESLKMLISN